MSATAPSSPNFNLYCSKMRTRISCSLFVGVNTVSLYYSSFSYFTKIEISILKNIMKSKAVSIAQNSFKKSKLKAIITEAVNRLAISTQSITATYTPKYQVVGWMVWWDSILLNFWHFVFWSLNFTFLFSSYSNGSFFFSKPLRRLNVTKSLRQFKRAACARLQFNLSSYSNWSNSAT